MASSINLSAYCTIYYILDLNNTTIMYYLKTFETAEEYNKILFYPNILLSNNLLYFNGGGYTDLGLSSGTLWMKCNIGAKSETDYGLYFQWGDTVGYTDSTASNLSIWQTSPFNGGDNNFNITNAYNWNKIHTKNGVLNTDVDAAYVHTNGLAKMPTKEQYQELLDETTQSWEENFNGSGINGVKFINKKNPSKYIFIPYTGYYWKYGRYNNYSFIWINGMASERIDVFNISEDNRILHLMACCSSHIRGVLM